MSPRTLLVSAWGLTFAAMGLPVVAASIHGFPFLFAISSTIARGLPCSAWRRVDRYTERRLLVRFYMFLACQVAIAIVMWGMALNPHDTIEQAFFVSHTNRPCGIALT